MILTHVAAPARCRRSFTLIELLITLSIVAILAATIVFLMAGALEQARVERAQAQVKKIHELLMRRWEEYRTRPVRLQMPRAAGGKQAALFRLSALREVMRMEMPDRITDVSDPTMSITVPGSSSPSLPPLTAPAQPIPSANRAYRRRSSGSWTVEHESAECLYLILGHLRDGDGSALDNFKPGEIGDVDSDGMKEVLDPWGTPIHFLRWAPLLQSPLQSNSAGQRAAAPDPFDPFRVGVPNSSAPNWALYPFVFSAGPDGEFGYDENTGFRYSATSPPWPNNPYDSKNTAGQRKPGNAWRDDIHNHLLE